MDLGDAMSLFSLSPYELIEAFINLIQTNYVAVFINLDFDLAADLTVENFNTSFAGGVVAHTNPAPGHRLARGA